MHTPYTHLLRRSRVLREIRNGQLATCAKLNLSDPRVVELCGLAGYSTVWMCMEHVPNDWQTIENSIRAAKMHDMDVIVRVARGSYSDYVRPLECDATGLMIPHVETEEDARRIVEYCRFQPVGCRALDGGNMDGAFCQVPVSDYLHHANSERFLIMQIESPRGIQNLEEIAAVPGYEFLLFGAGDYAHRIGKPGQYSCAEVESARRQVERAALKHGKTCLAVGLQLEPQQYKERNYSIITLASDVMGLGTYLADQVKTIREETFATSPQSVYALAKEKALNSKRSHAALSKSQQDSTECR